MFDPPKREATAFCTNCMSYFHTTVTPVSDTICNGCKEIEIEIERRRRLNSNNTLPTTSIVNSNLFTGLNPYNNSRMNIGFIGHFEPEVVYHKTIKLNKKLLLL